LKVFETHCKTTSIAQMESSIHLHGCFLSSWLFNMSPLRCIINGVKLKLITRNKGLANMKLIYIVSFKHLYIKIEKFPRFVGFFQVWNMCMMIITQILLLDMRWDKKWMEWFWLSMKIVVNQHLWQLFLIDFSPSLL
jgi:hypothetical protein